MCTILKIKVGKYVDIKTIAKQVIMEKRGITKTADFVQTGIRAVGWLRVHNYLNCFKIAYYHIKREK